MFTTVKCKHSAALKSSLVAVEQKQSNSVIAGYLLGLFPLRFILILVSLIYMQRLVVFRADSQVRQEDLHPSLTGGNHRAGSWLLGDPAAHGCGKRREKR